MRNQQSFNSAEKLELFSLVRTVNAEGKRFTRRAQRVFELMVDKAASCHWSSARIAAALGYSMRTVAYAMAELREGGFVTSVRKRRETAVKTVNVAAAREALRKGVELVKAICAMARKRRRFLDVQESAGSNHLVRDIAPWREQSAPSAALLRLLRSQKAIGPG